MKLENSSELIGGLITVCENSAVDKKQNNNENNAFFMLPPLYEENHKMTKAMIMQGTACRYLNSFLLFLVF